MSNRKRGQPVKYSAAVCRRVVEWKNLTELCKELGIKRRAADWIRAKCRQVSR